MPNFESLRSVSVMVSTIGLHLRYACWNSVLANALLVAPAQIPLTGIRKKTLVAGSVFYTVKIVFRNFDF